MRLLLPISILSLLLTSNLGYGGLKKSEPSLIQKEITEKSIYKENGGLNLESILDLKENTKISFKIKDKNYPAIVNKVEMLDNKIIIAGKLLEETNAGFFFAFNSTDKIVAGLVYFSSVNVGFVLKYNKEKDFFFLEEQKVSIRPLSPQNSASNQN